MDQKRAMLYPDPNGITQDQRSSAAANMGLPVEAPPSYDAATRDTPGWAASAPDASTSHFGQPPAERYPPSQPAVIVEHSSYPQPTPASTFPYPNAGHESTSTTITVQPNLSTSLGPNPSKVTCPACGSSKTSRMSFTPNSKTHLCAFILCLVGWCCCACVVPYCMNSCRTGNHYCSKCNAFLGTYEPPPLLK